MTVRELIEKLEQFRQDLEVMIPDPEWRPSKSCPYVHITNVAQGVNEMDGVVIIDDYVEDDNTYNDDDWEWYK